MLVVTAQRLQGDLLEIAVVRQDQANVVVFDEVFFCDLDDILCPNELGLAGLGVFLFDVFELLGDHRLLLQFVREHLFKVCDLGLQALDLLDAVEDVFAVDVAKLDLGEA